MSVRRRALLFLPTVLLVGHGSSCARADRADAKHDAGVAPALSPVAVTACSGPHVQLAAAFEDPSCLFDADAGAPATAAAHITTRSIAAAPVRPGDAATLTVSFTNTSPAPTVLWFSLPPATLCTDLGESIGAISLGHGIGTGTGAARARATKRPQAAPAPPPPKAKRPPCGFTVEAADAQGGALTHVPPSRANEGGFVGLLGRADVTAEPRRVVRVELPPGGEASVPIEWPAAGYTVEDVRLVRQHGFIVPPLAAGRYRVTIITPLVTDAGAARTTINVDVEAATP